MCNLEKTDITSAHCRLAARVSPSSHLATLVPRRSFSLKQQAIVAEVKGYVTFMDVKTGRPVDIRTLGGGWSKMFDAFTQKSKN